MSPFIYYFWLKENKTQGFLDKEYPCGNGHAKSVFCSYFQAAKNLTTRVLKYLVETQPYRLLQFQCVYK